MMKTKLTVVVDNTGNEELAGEWGLCVLVEYGEKKILLDAGSSELFAENMKKLGLDITAVDYGVLSHAHYDHGNGMPRFFRDNGKAEFYLQEAADENCYKRLGIFMKYIGLPRHVTIDFADRIQYVSGDYQLTDGVWLIPHKTPNLELIGKREKMYQRTGLLSWKLDDFSHEQSLVLDTDEGLVILNSCSHGGAVNIINEVRKTFPDKKIYGYVGGMHLFNKTDEEVEAVAKNIAETGIEYICTGHCTRGHAYGILKQALGERLDQLRVGLVKEF